MSKGFGHLPRPFLKFLNPCFNSLMSAEVYSKDILAPIFADKVGEEWFVKRKIAFGADGSYTDVTSSTPFPVTDANVPLPRSATSTITRVTSSATSVNLLVSNTSRLSAVLYNDSTQIVYVKFGTTASNTSFTVAMDPKATLILEENPIYIGPIDAIWVSANGAMQITELTA